MASRLWQTSSVAAVVAVTLLIALATLVARMRDRAQVELRRRLKAETDERERAQGVLLEAQRSLAAVRQSEQDLEHALADRQAIEAQLRHAQKLEAVGQLTGGVAHDFNNLLGVIIGNLDLLLDGLGADPARAALVREALDAAMRGADLTKRLLAVARQQPLSNGTIDLNARLPGLVAMLRRTLGEDIQISTSLAEGLWPARADASQVEDALLNLAINARDAMAGGGLLTIETANAVLDPDFAAARAEVTPGDYVVLSVTDTGDGMPPEVVERATEPFFSTKPMGEGTGLGLSMIYGFAKQSGGHLSIYSQLGVGTTIRLYLPRSDYTDASEEALRPDNEPPAGGGETILVVDDNADLRRVVVRRLSHLGYRCREAGSGREALGMIAAGERFDLLFTDVGLPDGMSGHELAIQAKQAQPGLKVLLTTGYAGADLRDAAGEPYRLPVLRKPYLSEELAETIRGVLDAPA